jgi:ATP-dependent RNA helicase DHX8/PRP22
MYTKDDYDKMESSTKPEILKMHLGMAVLQLLSLGVTDIEQFDFVESPSPAALKKALESLKLLGALNNDGTLNHLGKEMLKLPTEPQLSKALLEGLDRGCGNDVIIAAALMSGGHDVFYRGKIEKRNECAIQKQEFCQTSGDLLSAIDVYKKWFASKTQVAWCMANALNSKLLRSARETGNEIRDALFKIRPGLNLEVTAENIEESLSKSLLAGYFENIAWSFGHEKLGYMAVSSDQKARIHPSSVLSSLGDQPEWVLYQQLKRTNDQVFLLNITPIKYEWLAEVAMHMLQYVDEEAIARSRVVRQRIYPVGPELVKAVIGYQGSTIKRIEASVSDYSARFLAIDRHSVFCAVECNVDKGMVDVYTTEDCLDHATNQVNDVIQTKRRELEGFSEIFISNVGGLKTLVANDLTTRLILQPGRSCKFDVFFEKEDVSEEVCIAE